MTRDVLSEPSILTDLDNAITRYRESCYREARGRMLREAAWFIPALLLALACAWAVGHSVGVTHGREMQRAEDRR